MIGAYGVGVDPNDLTANDTIQDLGASTRTPPNNVTFTVTGLVSGEDYILVGPRTGSSLDKAQDTHSALLTDNVTTSVVMTTAIPSDTPATGTIRIQDDNGVYVSTAYSSWTGSTYTLTAAYQGSDNANSSAGKNVFISYIDEAATSGSATFTSVFSSTRNLYGRTRDGGATPIKTHTADAAQLISTGGGYAVTRQADA